MIMKKQGAWIKVGQDPIVVVPKNGATFTLEEIKECIGGGWVEAVPLDGPEPLYLFVDEEGKLKNLPMNPAATTIAMMYGLRDIIAGDALICPASMVE